MQWAFITNMSQKRNKQGKYRKSHLGKLLILLVLSVGVYGAYTGNITATTTYVAEVAKLVDPVDDIGDKFKDTRKMVEAGLKAKEQVNKDSLLVARAEQAYKDAVDIHNASVQEYNLVLDAMELYGGGAINIFFEIAQSRNLLDNK